MRKKRDKDRELAEKKQLGARLRQVRAHLGYKQDEMASLMGIMKVTYGKNERGVHQPTFQTLSALHHRLGISAEWFLFGCGPMFWDKARAPQGAEVSAAEPFSEELSEMISLMERIPLVRHSIMLYFQKLKIDHQELIQARLTEDAEEA